LIDIINLTGIVGSYTVSDYFDLTMYANHAPSVGEKISIDGKIYEVESVVDCTEDDEANEGLSYSRVQLQIIDLLS
jgi:hypothetical protein